MLAQFSDFYPSDLPGLSWSVGKMPFFVTDIEKAQSGRQVPFIYQGEPRWRFSLEYEFLNQSGPGVSTINSVAVGLNELMLFFAAHGGRWGDFWFNDTQTPDNQATLEFFAKGDGVTKSFQLAKSYGGLLVPVQGIDPGPGFSIYGPHITGTPAPKVYINGVQNTMVTFDYVLGQVNFASAPGNHLPLTWSGFYYYHCHFDMDTSQFANFLFNYWKPPTVKFISYTGTWAGPTA